MMYPFNPAAVSANFLSSSWSAAEILELPVENFTVVSLLLGRKTREHLTATDVAIVRFRRLMLGEAKALAEGREPDAPRRAESYRLRAGGALASSKFSFEDVMRQRFGSATGKVAQ